jgi:hypothetical protein
VRARPRSDARLVEDLEVEASFALRHGNAALGTLLLQAADRLRALAPAPGAAPAGAVDGEGEG